MKEENAADMGKNNKCKEEVSLEPRKVAVTSQDKKFFDEFQALIEKSLADPDFDIEILCKKLVISRSSLFRKVKQITDKTPFEFIQSYRLDRGAQLLKENFGNVSEVSEAVGFSDQFYFSKCFKKKFCQSPKQYQLAQLDESGRKKLEEPKNITNRPRLSFQVDFTIDELDREIISRIAITKSKQPFNFEDKTGTIQRQEMSERMEKFYDPGYSLSLNKNMARFTLEELLQKARQAIEDKNADIFRNEFYSDERLDLFDITDNRVRTNAHTVAAVCMSSDLYPDISGYFKLRVKTYGPTFNLHNDELFFNQPIGAGRIYTGVLVGKDMIVTAAHFANEKNVSDLRFVFDFVMLDPTTPVEKIPAENIYKGIEIIERIHNPERDWTLVKLDRNVTNREVASLSQRNIFYEQPVYVIGNPCGLPLKYAPGARVEDITGSYFRAGLDIYGSSSGSPIFCAKTHELIGIVSRAKPVDFRWTGSCWVTMRYPKVDIDNQGAQCNRVSEFGKYL